MSCLDKIDSVLEGLKGKMHVREQLKPLFDAGWKDLGDMAHITIRERPGVWVGVSANEHGGLVMTAAPGAVKCEIKSLDEAVEFVAGLRKAVEEATV